MKNETATLGPARAGLSEVTTPSFTTMPWGQPLPQVPRLHRGQLSPGQLEETGAY